MSKKSSRGYDEVVNPETGQRAIKRVHHRRSEPGYIEKVQLGTGHTVFLEQGVCADTGETFYEVVEDPIIDNYNDSENVHKRWGIETNEKANDILVRIMLQTGEEKGYRVRPKDPSEPFKPIDGPLEL